MRPSRREIAKDYIHQNNTLLRPVKNDAADRLELEIGDAKQPEFIPQAKIKRWDNETNFSIRRDNGARSFVERAGKIVAEGAEENVVIYELEPDEQNEDGGLEIEIELPRQPRTNVFEFTLQTKGLNFYYQPEITDEEAEQVREGKADIRSLEEIKRSMRPENVVGSYAVYHATKRDNRVGGKHYKTGKAFHIYRPKAIDADKNEVWCDLHIDEAAGILTVTVPEKWLTQASYPVRVDPTFGYNTAGASEAVAHNSAFDGFAYRGFLASLSEGAELTHLYAHLREEDDSTHDPKFNIQVYSDNAGEPNTLIDYTKFYVTLLTSSYWRGSFVENEAILSSGDYWLGVNYVSGAGLGRFGFSNLESYISYDTTTGVSSVLNSDILAGDPPPDPYGNSVNNTFQTDRIYSIYATYTVASSNNPPTVTTDSVLSVEATQVDAYGNVSDDGGAPITERGFCWSTSSNPTTADSTATVSGTTGSFNTTITGLSVGATYYVRAYAINSEGTSYGSEISFTTDDGTPDLGSGTWTNVTDTTVDAALNVTKDWGFSVTERGFLLSAATAPDISTFDIKHTIPGTTGPGNDTVTGLTPSTLYYVRPFATNANGTGYGALNFVSTTAPAGPTYTITCDTGSYSLTGNSATIAVSRTISCDTGSYTLSGYSTASLVNRHLPAVSETYTTTGYASLFEYTAITLPVVVTNAITNIQKTP